MEQYNINTRKYWEEKWEKINKGGWIKNKFRYQLLSFFTPTHALLTKPKKKYYLSIAKLVEGRFCDLGCGIGVTGGIYSVLTGNESFGLDHSLEGCKVGRKEAKKFRVPCRFMVGDIYRVGVKSNYFDTVYMGQILEHLDDDMSALREAIRLLRPGGKLIISVPTEHMPDDPEHINVYTSEKLRNMLVASGISDITFHDMDMDKKKKRYVVSGRRTI